MVNLEGLQDNALIVQSSKTDQTGEGVALYIGDRTIQIIKIYCAKANITSGALLRRIVRGGHIQESRLTVNGVRNAIKEWASVAGVEGFISGHSLRVGSAVTLGKPADVGVVVPRPVAIEACIGIELLAGELAGIIACSCLRANSTKHIVLVPDQDVLVVIG